MVVQCELAAIEVLKEPMEMFWGLRDRVVHILGQGRLLVVSVHSLNQGQCTLCASTLAYQLVPNEYRYVMCDGTSFLPCDCSLAIFL